MSLAALRIRPQLPSAAPSARSAGVLSRRTNMQHAPFEGAGRFRQEVRRLPRLWRGPARIGDSEESIARVRGTTVGAHRADSLKREAYRALNELRLQELRDEFNGEATVHRDLRGRLFGLPPELRQRVLDYLNGRQDTARNGLPVIQANSGHGKKGTSGAQARDDSVPKETLDDSSPGASWHNRYWHETLLTVIDEKSEDAGQARELLKNLLAAVSVRLEDREIRTTDPTAIRVDSQVVAYAKKALFTASDIHESLRRVSSEHSFQEQWKVASSFRTRLLVRYANAIIKLNLIDMTDTQVLWSSSQTLKRLLEGIAQLDDALSEHARLLDDLLDVYPVERRPRAFLADAPAEQDAFGRMQRNPNRFAFAMDVVTGPFTYYDPLLTFEAGLRVEDIMRSVRWHVSRWSAYLKQQVKANPTKKSFNEDLWEEGDSDLRRQEDELEHELDEIERETREAPLPSSMKKALNNSKAVLLRGIERLQAAVVANHIHSRKKASRLFKHYLEERIKVATRILDAMNKILSR